MLKQYGLTDSRKLLDSGHIDTGNIFDFSAKARLDPAVFAAATKLEAGQTSDPIVTSDGSVHVVVMIQRAPAQQRQYADVGNEVWADLKKEAQDQVRAANLKYLRSKASIRRVRVRNEPGDARDCCVAGGVCRRCASGERAYEERNVHGVAHLRPIGALDVLHSARRGRPAREGRHAARRMRKCPSYLTSRVSVSSKAGKCSLTGPVRAVAATEQFRRFELAFQCALGRGHRAALRLRSSSSCPRT